MSFFGELKRRNVFRVAGVYAVVGWLLVQVSTSMEEAIGLPEWFDGFVVALLAIGFPIALIFAWAFELTADGLKRTADVAPGESITAATGTKLDVIIVIALLSFAAAIVVPRFRGPGGGSSMRGGEALADPSIAVLPFADLSPDGDQEYFADGISEELLNVLSKLQDLRVIAQDGNQRHSSYRGLAFPIRQVAGHLDVVDHGKGLPLLQREADAALLFSVLFLQRGFQVLVEVECAYTPHAPSAEETVIDHGKRNDGHLGVARIPGNAAKGGVHFFKLALQHLQEVGPACNQHTGNTTLLVVHFTDIGDAPYDTPVQVRDAAAFIDQSIHISGLHTT